MTQSLNLTSALSTAVAGLRTTVGLINVASSNIANAQTPGYTEKTANVTSVDYGGTPGGSTIASYGRVTNTALTNNYNAATTSSGYSNTQNAYMQQVQNILDSSDTNPVLSDDIAKFASAWTQYSSDPSSSIQQQSVISAGQTLAKDVNTISSGIGQLQSQVVSDTKSAVTSFNTTLSTIASLNNQISSALNAKQSAGDLEDQRDAAINTLAGYANISIQQRGNGQIAVYLQTGQPLVDGPFANQYTYNGYTVNDSNGNSINSFLTGGSLQAQLDFVSNSASAATSTTPGVGVIAKLNAQLSKLVDAFTNGTGTTPSLFATAYSSAYTASTGTGGTQASASVASSFFTVNAGTADPGSFAVNAALLAGTSGLPQTGASGISDSFTATANYTASGLAVNSATYTQLGSTILSNFQQTANTISAQSTSATNQQSYYKTALANATGVNMDDELATLTALQNSYAATAHIITTVNSLFQTLLATIN